MNRDKIMRLWLSIWLYVIAAIGGGLIVYLLLCYKNLELYVILAAFTTLVLILHVLEEWQIPGGFHYMYNKVMRDSEFPDRYPMSQVTDMLTNFIPIMYCLVMLLIGMPYWAALTGAWLSIAEVFIHIGAGKKTRVALRDKGKQTIYNPGLATCLFGFLPVFLGYIYGFILKAPTIGEVGISVVIFIGLGAFCLKGVETLFQNKESKFPYDWGIGYFEKFQ